MKFYRALISPNAQFLLTDKFCYKIWSGNFILKILMCLCFYCIIKQTTINDDQLSFISIFAQVLFICDYTRKVGRFPSFGLDINRIHKTETRSNHLLKSWNRYLAVFQQKQEEIGAQYFVYSSAPRREGAMSACLCWLFCRELRLNEPIVCSKSTNHYLKFFLILKFGKFPWTNRPIPALELPNIARKLHKIAFSI